MVFLRLNNNISQKMQMYETIYLSLCYFCMIFACLSLQDKRFAVKQSKTNQ